MHGFNSVGKKSLSELVERSNIFTVRNDGSLENIRKILPSTIGELVEEVPDPGLIFDFEYERNSSDQIVSVLQPSFNGNQAIMDGRFLNNQNFKKILNIPHKMGLKIFPHSPKDYRHFNKVDSVFSLNTFRGKANINTYLELISYYSRVKSSIAMRGHGQMIALSLNVPSLYLSTQDKVLNFSQKHQLMDYTVDITDSDWENKLFQMFKNLNDDNNSSYLESWYDQRDFLIKNFKDQFSECCVELKKDIELRVG